MVKYIRIQDGRYSQNQFAAVDDEMFDYLSRREWKVSIGGHAYRTGTKEDGDYFRKRIFMHRVINQTPEGFFTDHIDRNKLNNVRTNLRTCTNKENCANVAPFENKISQYKGVTFVNGNKWRVRVSSYGHVGYFECEKAAAEAYNQKAKEIYGEFAYQNGIKDHDDCEICKNVKKRKYTGVYRSGNKFRVQMKIDNTQIHVGYFNTEEEAVIAYNKKAIELLGDKAKLNVI